MLARIPERLFVEWMAFYRLEPFGNSWRQTARQLAMQQNIHRGKHSRAQEEDEFMPGYQQEQKSTESLGVFLRMMANKQK